MPSQFNSILHNAPLMDIVWSYQCGLYQDVIQSIDEYNRLVDFLPIRGASNGVYRFHSSFHQVKCPKHHVVLNEITTEQLCLNENNTVDHRFPLHLAIFEGHYELTVRFLICKPQWAFSEAIACAFSSGRLEIVKYLLSLRNTSADYFRLNTPFDPWLWHFPNYPSRVGAELTMYVVAYDNIQLLQYLDQFMTTSIWTKEIMAHAIRCSAIHVVQYLLENHYEAIVYPTLMDDAVGTGSKDLLQLLHRYDFKCTANATDTASAIHLLMLLNWNCTQSCTMHHGDNVSILFHPRRIEANPYESNEPPTTFEPKLMV